jgi:iron-sulfur cluster assembly accessory protein
MGTFHDGRGDLHGITVVVETAGPEVYVGRFDLADADSILLHDVDLHADGEGGTTNEDYLRQAARFGVWKKHESLRVPASGVTVVRPLADYVKGRPNSPAPAPEAAPAPPPVAEDDVVGLTDAAAAEVQRLLSAEEAGKGLRLAVKGGGCSGLVYDLCFDAERDGDVILDRGDFRVFLDRKSSIYLRGITLDHQGGLGGKGFVFRNPNATNTCGCGESFSV